MKVSLLLLAALLPGLLPVAPVRAGAAPLRSHGVVAGDATWSGTVRILGQTVVKKGATLTILPGTKVLFEWSDEDGNGIGDGELKVEGRLVARGTPREMITFTSARKDPAMKDWTYVMIELGNENVVEDCIFEYAFTGLQIHFATAVVRHSLFRHNFEALRFSTADVLIERNDITGNTYGIRYESRGSETTIRKNRVVGNEFGFFPVLKSSSTVKIHGNAIENRSYNVKMGAEQREDLDFRENWWGSDDPEQIEEGFFDRRRDRTLGMVLYAPFLTEPPPESGTERREGED